MNNNKKNFSDFFRVMLRMRKILDQSFEAQADKRISSTLQVLVLQTIQDNSEITASELGAELEMSSSAVTQMTDRLIYSQLIERNVDKDDRRLVRLTLSSHGKKHLEKILGEMEEKASQILTPIDQKDLETVISIFSNFLKKYEETSQENKA